MCYGPVIYNLALSRMISRSKYFLSSFEVNTATYRIIWLVFTLQLLVNMLPRDFEDSSFHYIIWQNRHSLLTLSYMSLTMIQINLISNCLSSSPTTRWRRGDVLRTMTQITIYHHLQPHAWIRNNLNRIGFKRLHPNCLNPKGLSQ